MELEFLLHSYFIHVWKVGWHGAQTVCSVKWKWIYASFDN